MVANRNLYDASAVIRSDAITEEYSKLNAFVKTIFNQIFSALKFVRDDNIARETENHLLYSEASATSTFSLFQCNGAIVKNFSVRLCPLISNTACLKSAVKHNSRF